MPRTFEMTGWIFDLDGTLTEPVHDFDAIRSMLGLPEKAGILESISRLPRKQAQNLLRRLDEHEYELAKRARVSDGAADLLERLSSRQFRLGIFTRNNLRNTERTLVSAGLAEFFTRENLITRESAPPKPDPRGIHVLLERWARPARFAIMIGNHRIDIEAGRNAGVATALLQREGQDPRWRELADFCVASLCELSPA